MRSKIKIVNSSGDIRKGGSHCHTFLLKAQCLESPSDYALGLEDGPVSHSIQVSLSPQMAIFHRTDIAFGDRFSASLKPQQSFKQVVNFRRKPVLSQEALKPFLKSPVLLSLQPF